MQCYHCDQRFEVGSKAMTVSCPACFKPLMVQDLNIKTLEAVKRLETCGKIVIMKKGRVMADRVVGMGGVEVEGIMHGNVRSGRPVRIAAGAEWKGDLEAPGIELDPAAIVLGGYWQIPTRVLSDEAPRKLADGEAEAPATRARSSSARTTKASSTRSSTTSTGTTRKTAKKAAGSTVRPRAVRKAEPADDAQKASASDAPAAAAQPETPKPRVKIEPKPQRRTSILPETKPAAKKKAATKKAATEKPAVKRATTKKASKASPAEPKSPRKKSTRKKAT